LDERSHYETEPIRLKATASTFVVAKACSPITKTADEEPVPHFQQPLTCSVSTPPDAEDIDKSTSEVSYYSPQTNRMPSHFGVAKAASPNMRYAVPDNKTLEVFVSGPSPDLRRSSLAIEGRPVGIECEDCQWPPPPSPVVSSPPLPLGPAFPRTSRIPKVVTQSATTSQDGLYPCDFPSDHRRNTLSSLTLDRLIQPICPPGDGRHLSVSYPDLQMKNVRPQPVVPESLSRSLGNLLTAPPAISSHCSSPMTSPRIKSFIPGIITKARPQVTLAAPQLHVPNIHSPAINTTVSVPVAEMTKAPRTPAHIDTAHPPSSPEFFQLTKYTVLHSGSFDFSCIQLPARLSSTTQHSIEPGREPRKSVVPKAPGVDQQSSPSSLLISRVGSYSLSQLLSDQSNPPPEANCESFGSMRLTQRSSSKTSLSDVDVPTLKLYVSQETPSAKMPASRGRIRRIVHQNQSCSAPVPPLLAADHVNVETAEPHNGDLRSSLSSGSESPSLSYPLTYEELETFQYTVTDRKQAILKKYLQKNLDGLRHDAATRMSSLTFEESSSTSLPTPLGTTSKTMPTSEELSSKFSSLTVSSMLPLSTSLRDITSDIDITSPSSPSTVFHSLPNSGSPADSSPDSPTPTTWPVRTFVQRNNNNRQNTVLLSKHPVHLALPTRIHRGSPWYQTHRMQFRQLSVVEEASEVDGVLLKGETVCVYSPERLENQQLNSSPSLPASTPASSSRPSDQFSCLSASTAPETETNRGHTTTVTPLSRASAGDGATGSLSSSEITTLRYLHDLPYTPKSPTMDKSDSAVSVTDTSFFTPYVTAISLSQQEHNDPVSLDLSAVTSHHLGVVVAPDNPVSTSVGLTYDSASQGLVSLSSGCTEGNSVQWMNYDPVLALLDAKKSQASPTSPLVEDDDDDVTFTELSAHMEEQIRLQGDGTETADPSPISITRMASSASLLSFLRHEKSCSSSLETYYEMRDVTPCKVPLSQPSTVLPVGVDHTECTKPLLSSAILSTSSSSVVGTNSESMHRATVSAGGQMMEAQPVGPETPKLTDSGVQTPGKQLANKTGSAVWGRLLSGTIASRARQRAIQEELKKSDGTSRQIPRIRVSKYSSRLKGPFELKAVECNRPLECIVEKTTNWRILHASGRTMNTKPTDFLTLPANLNFIRNRPVAPVSSRLARSQSPSHYKAESDTGNVAILEKSLTKKKSDSSNPGTSKAGPIKKSKGLFGSCRNMTDPYLASVSPRTLASTNPHPKPADIESSGSKICKKSSSDLNSLILNSPLTQEAPDLTANDSKITNAASVKLFESGLKRTSSHPSSSRLASTGSHSSRSKQGFNCEKSTERLRKEEAARTNRERVRQFDQASLMLHALQL
uniref:Sorbin and SH3 domain containing 2a n=1 Tax=Schistocephalus solidus TaxID=70667 RepID=A0A183SSA4_SCHSO